MPTINKIRQDRHIGGPPMLKGSSVPKSIGEVKVKCKELRLAPTQFKSPAIMDLEKPIYDCEAWAVNITNLRAIAVKCGFGGDLDEVEFDEIAERAAGKTFVLVVAMVNNPDTKQMTRSLFIETPE